MVSTSVGASLDREDFAIVRIDRKPSLDSRPRESDRIRRVLPSLARSGTTRPNSSHPASTRRRCADADRVLRQTLAISRVERGPDFLELYGAQFGPAGVRVADHETPGFQRANFANASQSAVLPREAKPPASLKPASLKTVAVKAIGLEATRSFVGETGAKLVRKVTTGTVFGRFEAKRSELAFGNPARAISAQGRLPGFEDPRPGALDHLEEEGLEDAGSLAGALNAAPSGISASAHRGSGKRPVLSMSRAGLRAVSSIARALTPPGLERAGLERAGLEKPGLAKPALEKSGLEIGDTARAIAPPARTESPLATADTTPSVALVPDGSTAQALLVVCAQASGDLQEDRLEEAVPALCQILGACGLSVKVAKLTTPNPAAANPTAPNPTNQAADGARSHAEPGDADLGNSEPGILEPGNSEPGNPETANPETGDFEYDACEKDAPAHEEIQPADSSAWMQALGQVPQRQNIYFVWTGNWETDLAVVEALRARGERGAIMALSRAGAAGSARAHLDASARLRLLEAGADEVWMSPREPEELVACTKVLLQRLHIKIESDIRALVNLRLDYGRRIAWVHPRGRKVRLLADREGAKTISLTQVEFHLLDLLMRRGRAGVSTAEFEANEYADGRYPGKGTRDVYMHRLRRKLVAAGADVEIVSSSGAAVLRRASGARPTGNAAFENSGSNPGSKPGTKPGGQSDQAAAAFGSKPETSVAS